jgi:hypothetical protein
MFELHKYFRILFLSHKISRERLQAFCEYHIIALTNHNPGGIFTTLLTDVTNAFTAYYGDLVSASTNEAVKQGKTIAMKAARAALEKNISDNERLVAYTYRSDVRGYEEFYPHGVFEYYQADITELEIITDRYKQVLASRVADFPLQFSTDFNTLQATFIANRQAQLGAMGKVSGERSDLVHSRAVLAKQLTKNLLVIAANFLGNDKACNIYFDTETLRAAFRENKRSLTDFINPAETQTLFNNIRKGALRITMKNEGEVPLYFGFTEAAESPVARIKVEPGHTLNLAATELGWTSKIKFFNVTNTALEAGKFSVAKK